MMKRIFGMLSLLLILVFALIACSTGTVGTKLGDTVWVLESYGKPGNLKAVIADTEITAQFVSTEETVKGSAGCNSYFSSYELKGGQLSILEPSVTEMYCMDPEGVMDQEQEYLAVLQLAESYEIDSNELQINCGSQVLIFRK